MNVKSHVTRIIEMIFALDWTEEESLERLLAGVELAIVWLEVRREVLKGSKSEDLVGN